MRFYSHEKMALIVDGAHAIATTNAMQLSLDWSKLAEFFSRQATLVSCRFYHPGVSTEEFNPIVRLLDFLETNGWQVSTIGGTGTVDLCVDVMEMAPWVDHFVLGVSRTEYTGLVDALKRKGRRVSLLSTTRVKGWNCADDLRRSADQFIDWDDLRAAIHRAPKEGTPA